MWKPRLVPRLFGPSRSVGPPLQAPRLQPVRLARLTQASVAARYAEPRLGGDFYDFLLTGSGWVLFVLLDIAGGRDQALPIIARAQDCFRGRGSELFANAAANLTDSMTELLMELNRTIIQSAGEIRCAPTFIGCYGDDLGVFCYINAGHTPGLWKENDEITFLHANGIPLGCFSHALYDPQVKVLRSGASLLLVSKGVIESRSDNQEFGLERVRRVLAEKAYESADELCAAVLGWAKAFTPSSSTSDDLTVLALLRR